ncbi:MAG: hypothetical protein IPH31_16125 [Lewinellaceae bacterium]|nr:hypothetical protein [Lewinellaceae bacterium]
MKKIIVSQWPCANTLVITLKNTEPLRDSESGSAKAMRLSKRNKTAVPDASHLSGVHNGRACHICETEQSAFRTGVHRQVTII